MTIPRIICEGDGLPKRIEEFALAEAVEMKIEFFAEFALPLRLNAGGCEDKNTFSFLGDEERTEN